MATNELYFSREQVEAFAAGLYQLSKSDGIDEREMEVIKDFLDETGNQDLMSDLDGLHFDPATAYEVFESTWLRKLFLRAALLLVRMDGKITDDERESLAWMADAFGVAGGYEAIVSEVEGDALST